MLSLRGVVLCRGDEDLRQHAVDMLAPARLHRLDLALHEREPLIADPRRQRFLVGRPAFEHGLERLRLGQ
jgi:hypothetical protein